MFICADCIKPEDVLYSSLKSRGRCEICGHEKDCFDVDIHSGPRPIEIIEEMKNITAPEVIQVVIREDGKVVWINTEKCCVFRACKIKLLEIDDRRPKAISLSALKDAKIVGD